MQTQDSGGRRCKSNSKNPIVNRSVIQVNNCLAPIQEKQSIIQTIDMAYLGQSFSHSLSQPVVAPPIVSQLGPQLVSVQCGSAQLSHPSTVVSLAAA